MGCINAKNASEIDVQRTADNKIDTMVAQAGHKLDDMADVLITCAVVIRLMNQRPVPGPIRAIEAASVVFALLQRHASPEILAVFATPMELLATIQVAYELNKTGGCTFALKQSVANAKIRAHDVGVGPEPLG